MANLWIMGMLVDTCIVSQSVSEESRGHYGYDDQYIIEVTGTYLSNVFARNERRELVHPSSIPSYVGRTQIHAYASISFVPCSDAGTFYV
jgi:hypothetical protein